MHVHAQSHGASSVQNYAANSGRSANARPSASAVGTSANGTAPSMTAISDQTTGPTGTATANTAGGASSDPFTQLSTNLQALLLGVGQGAQSAAGAARATATQALNAYGATSSFLSPATL